MNFSNWKAATAALAAALMTLFVVAGCGDDTAGGGGAETSAGISACLEEAGMDVATVSLQDLEPKDLQAGVIEEIRAVADPQAGVANIVRVFATAEEASAFAEKNHGGGVLHEAYGATAIEAFDDDPAIEDLARCAEAGG